MKRRILKLWKVLLKMVILQYKEKQRKNQFFSVKSFEDILEHFKERAPQESTRTEITELEQFFDSVEKCTHSETISSQANVSYMKE